MGYGYMVEEECEFLDRFGEDDVIDDYDRPQPDVVYETCPYYETFTQEELEQMRADDEAEMEFFRQMDEEAKKYLERYPDGRIFVKCLDCRNKHKEQDSDKEYCGAFLYASVIVNTGQRKLTERMKATPRMCKEYREAAEV
jgi:hypothetical protein